MKASQRYYSLSFKHWMKFLSHKVIFEVNFIGNEDLSNNFIYQNTSDIVVFARLLLLAKVSDDVVAEVVALAHDVEQERVGVVVESLVIEAF